MEEKSIPLKPTVKSKPTSKEGVLIDKEGNTIYDDSWLHEDVMAEDENGQRRRL
mgnify:CR=1 FL=1